MTAHSCAKRLEPRFAFGRSRVGTFSTRRGDRKPLDFPADQLFKLGFESRFWPGDEEQQQTVAMLFLDVCLCAFHAVSVLFLKLDS